MNEIKRKKKKNCYIAKFLSQYICKVGCTSVLKETKHIALFQNGDSSAEELASATHVHGDYMPITREKPVVELVKVTDEMKAFKAYQKLRLEQTNKRHHGARLKKAAEAEKDEKK